MVIHAECKKMDIQSLLKTIKAKISDQSTVDRSHLSISLIRFVWKSLKISENLATKTFQKFWETVFSSTKVLTGADTSAPLAGILNLIYAGSQCLCPGWDVCFLSTVMWVFNTCWAWTEFFFNLIWFPQNENQHFSSCSCLVVWTDQSQSAMLHYKNCS